MQENLEGFSISCHDYKLGDSTVKGLGSLVGTLSQLLVVGGLLDQIKDAVGEGGIGKRECFGVRSAGGLWGINGAKDWWMGKE